MVDRHTGYNPATTKRLRAQCAIYLALQAKNIIIRQSKNLLHKSIKGFMLADNPVFLPSETKTLTEEARMSDQKLDSPIDIITLTADIASAYVSYNPLPATEVAALIETISQSVRKLRAPEPAAAEPPVPAVPVRKSITPDYLISLENGKPYKSLKRHLSQLGLTPDAYRAKWGLRSDYPMVAANYSKVRSDVAKKIGLGRKNASDGGEPKRGRARRNKAS